MLIVVEPLGVSPPVAHQTQIPVSAFGETPQQAEHIRFAFVRLAGSITRLPYVVRPFPWVTAAHCCYPRTFLHAYFLCISNMSKIHFPFLCGGCRTRTYEPFLAYTLAMCRITTLPTLLTGARNKKFWV